MQPVFRYELFAYMFAALEIRNEEVVGGCLGSQCRIGDRVEHRGSVVALARTLGTIVKMYHCNGQWSVLDATGDRVIYRFEDPVQAAVAVREWDVTDDLRRSVERAAAAYSKAISEATRKRAIVESAAMQEAKAKGFPVAFADCQDGHDNIATRWSIATPDGRLVAAVIVYSGCWIVRGEGLADEVAKLAVKVYDRKRWAAVYAAA